MIPRGLKKSADSVPNFLGLVVSSLESTNSSLWITNSRGGGGDQKVNDEKVVGSRSETTATMLNRDYRLVVAATGVDRQILEQTRTSPERGGILQIGRVAARNGTNSSKQWPSRS